MVIAHPFEISRRLVGFVGGSTPVQRLKVAREHFDNFVLFGKPHDTRPMPYVTYATKNLGASQDLSSQWRFSGLQVLTNQSATYSSVRNFPTWHG
jgi:hypothetical protein